MLVLSPRMVELLQNKRVKQELRKIYNFLHLINFNIHSWDNIVEED